MTASALAPAGPLAVQPENRRSPAAGEPGTQVPGARPPRTTGRTAGARRVPAPSLAPPYDDERWDASGPAGAAGYAPATRKGGRVSREHDGLPLPLPFPVPSAAVPRLRLGTEPEPTGTAAAQAPPAAWSARFVRVMMEALAGMRPLSQLGAWATADVCRALSRRVGAAGRYRDLPRSAGSLHSLHVSTPTTGVAEVCAVLQFGGRVRALALRIEARDGQWRCTDLALG